MINEPTILAYAPTWVGEASGDMTRYAFQITDLDSQNCYYVSLPDFGRSARIGREPEWQYVADKLHLSKPDAINVTEIIRHCEIRAGRRAP